MQWAKPCTSCGGNRCDCWGYGNSLVLLNDRPGFVILRVGQSAGDEARRMAIDNLLDNCDILCIQGDIFSKQDLEKLNSFNDNFHDN